MQGTKFGTSSQGRQRISSDLTKLWFVDDAENWNNVQILRLRNELGDDPNIIQHAFSVCNTHHATEEVDLTRLSGMVKP